MRTWRRSSIMGKSSETTVSLLRRYFGEYELPKQKLIWRAFGVDYEAEKAKQTAIWKEFQARQKNIGGRGGSDHRSDETIGQKVERLLWLKQTFLKILGELNTQMKREKALERLEELAEIAHSYVGSVDDMRLKVKWARVEAYIYQTINSVLKAYDEAQIKDEIAQIKKVIAELLGDKDKDEENAGSPPA